MTQTPTSNNEPDEIYNPFSPAPSTPAPGTGDDDAAANTDQGQRKQYGSGQPSTDQPSSDQASGDQSSSDQSAADVMFQAPDLSKVAPKQPAQQDQHHSTDDDGGPGGRKNSRRKRRRGGRQKGRGENGEQQSSESSDSSAGDSGDGQQKSGQQKNAQQKQGSGQSKKSRGSSNKESSNKDSPPSSGNGGAESAEEDDDKVIRRTRRRRRGSSDLDIEETDEDGHTVTRIRSGREAGENAPDKVTGVKGSTRLEAKRQRRRDSRNGGRRRGIITEAEFLARRESVDRKMIVRQRGERIQIGVLEDGVLAEHYVSHTTADSLIGNVYLGKVQNVLPSMEAAFVDIGRGRNAVLYAGEVDWSASNIGNAPRKIENALKSGDSVLVQVTKDPVGHKGARLTSQVSLPGRYLVYVPGGSMTGISRKLPDTERARLKKVLRDQMPADAGVIVRTAAEGASEEELTNDVNRLRALWESIETQSKDKKVLAPEMLYAEPDLTIKVVRDVFNEDFSAMEVQGEETWDSVEAYVTYVAPHLLDRCRQWSPEEGQTQDIFAHHRIDEQLNKALQRHVNLPSGGSLVFDRTEAMTVVDVNTGKFTGSGGNLEETVTKNNLEAAEELVRQLRLRDIGGIIVVDFIDMVLESNRDLVLRRMVECLGRDRTKHQVAEVTSLGLVQMTRKRMGTGLLEVFSSECEHCAGLGYHTHPEPVEKQPSYNSHGDTQSSRGSKKRRNKRRRDDNDRGSSAQERNKLEQASQGMAKVAAATNGSGNGGSTDGDSNKDSSTDGSGTKHDADKAVLTIGGEEVEVPRGSAETQSGDNQPAAPKADQQKTGQKSGQKTDQQSAQKSGQKPEGKASLDSVDQALDSRSATGGRRPAPKRRRRAAGSAQGASGEVSQVDTSASGAGSTFAASAAETEPGQSKPAQEPVMLGVGVSAEQISRAQ
ncbi:Rne/Rng family ribonuclease [Garicola koreensis]|uniref:Ribonuclease E n=1 Tax=Garicola koreensis TaxID=1262554 RepID=A0A7W5XKK6_9MICC|nr:Rne/Rng family ribonuclease [Garicola koreensis]MBB3667040.1 ribonuclease E [Garicola koreensis]